MTITTIGVDLAKNSFQLHGVDHTGRTVLRKKLSRSVNGGVILERPAEQNSRT